MGPCFTLTCIIDFGVYATLFATCSCIVNTFIACCVTILCRALLGIGWNVVGGGVVAVANKAIACQICSDLRCPCAALWVSLTRRVINGNPPGVLLRVTRRCNRGVSFSILFAIGLRDCIIAGASVMRRIVSIGLLSNTLCWFSLSTLCSS